MNQSDATYNSGNLRAMDANINRATEGLRVVEDFCRFIINDRFLSECAKRLRHQLISAVSSELSRKFVCHRDATSDVGATIQTESEYQRIGAHSLVQANLKRAQQALRSLEEFSKTFDGQLAVKMENLRYQSYSFESSLVATLNGQASIAGAAVYVLIDGDGPSKNFSSRVRQMVESGVDILQLRSKKSDDRELIAQCQAIQKAIREVDPKTSFIINDRPDIAKITNADGVHLGQNDLSVSQARTILGSDFTVGVSTHSMEQARTAVTDGANYIGVGPVFPSTTKKFDNFPGLHFVAQVANELSLPAFAIGGIDTDNVEQIVENGIRRVAVGNAIWNSSDPVSAVERIKRKLESMPC